MKCYNKNHHERPFSPFGPRPTKSFTFPGGERTEHGDIEERAPKLDGPAHVQADQAHRLGPGRAHEGQGQVPHHQPGLEHLRHDVQVTLAPAPQAPRL